MATSEKIEIGGGLLEHRPATASERSDLKARLLERWHLIVFTISLVFTLASFITDALDVLPSHDSDLLALVAVVVGGTSIVVEGVGALIHKDMNVEFLATIAIIAAVVVPLSMMIRACSRMRATPARAIACLYGETDCVGSLNSSCGTGTAPP